MNGENGEVKEKAKLTTMSDFFRNSSLEEKREVYRAAAVEAIAMQNAVILAAKVRSGSHK